MNIKLENIEYIRIGRIIEADDSIALYKRFINLKDSKGAEHNIELVGIGEEALKVEMEYTQEIKI